MSWRNHKRITTALKNNIMFSIAILTIFGALLVVIKFVEKKPTSNILAGKVLI